jgi:hypothetical protein
VEKKGMVDALRESCRVLAPSGVLIDVRPLIEPLVVEVLIGAEPVWSNSVDSFSAPDDVAAAEAAARHAASLEWFAFESSLRFNFDVYCGTAAELRVYAEGRRLEGAEIPYEQLDERRRELAATGHPARLRCRRPWMVSTWRRNERQADL